MPKRIIIKKPLGEKREENETPIIEPVKTAEEKAETEQVQERNEEMEATIIPRDEQPLEDIPEATLLESANKSYEAFKKRIEYIIKKDRAFQEMCIDKDITTEAIRSILSKLREERERAVREASQVKEKLEEAKHRYMQQFSEIEAELYWTRLEKITESDRIEPDVEDELKRMENKLVTLKNKIRELDNWIKELNEIPGTIYEVSTYKEYARMLYEELKKHYIIRYGERADGVLSAEIQKLAQEEDIPREYAIILLRKRVYSQPEL